MTQTNSQPRDGAVVPALQMGPVFYAWPVGGERFPARIVDARMRPFPWHRVSGAYVLKRVATEDNVPVLSYDWFEAAAPAPDVLAAFPGEGGQ